MLAIVDNLVPHDKPVHLVTVWAVLGKAVNLN